MALARRKAQGKDATRPTLEGVDLENLVKRLVLYAELLLARHRTWRENASSGPPGALTAQDFVNEALLKYLTGERRRPADIPLDKFLTQVIRSLISHLAEKPESRWQHVFLTDAEVVGVGLFPVAALPGNAYATTDQRLMAEDLLRLVRERCGDDQLFVLYATLLLRRVYEDSTSLASALCISVAEAANLRRRLDRFVARLRREGGY